MVRKVLLGVATAAFTLAAAGAASAAGALIVHHKVADYTKWRPVFDGDKANQEAAGLTNPRVYESPTNPKDLTIVFDMADLAKAKAFASSKTLKAAMANAGVVGKPTITYLNSAP